MNSMRPGLYCLTSKADKNVLPVPVALITSALSFPCSRIFPSPSSAASCILLGTIFSAE